MARFGLKIKEVCIMSEFWMRPIGRAAQPCQEILEENQVDVMEG